MIPSLACVLQHWYELPIDQPSVYGTKTARFTAISSTHSFVVWQGKKKLLKTLRDVARGRRALSPSDLIVGAALFPENVEIELLVQEHINHGFYCSRAAAIYASLFFFYRAAKVACLVSAQALLKDGAESSLAAAKDVLTIWSETCNGGCTRCDPVDDFFNKNWMLKASRAT